MSFAVGFLKPDCLKRKLAKTIYSVVEASGLKVVFKKRMKLNPTIVEELYRDCENEDFYNGLCQYMVSGEVEVFIVKGDDAIERLQKLVGERGSTNPSRNTIRGRFATSARENVIHSTTNREAFKREAKLLLGKEARKWLES